MWTRTLWQSCDRNFLTVLSHAKSSLTFSAPSSTSVSRFFGTTASVPLCIRQMQMKCCCSSRRLLKPRCTSSHPCTEKGWGTWSRNSSSRWSGRSDAQDTLSSADTPGPTHKPLPKLPLPEVKDTMSKYLTVLSTVLSPHELHVTTQHVQEFMAPGGGAENLQAYLLKRRSETDNWAYNYWLHDMYLNVRLPLLVNSNAALLFSKQHFSNKEQQLRHASRLIQGVLDYKSKADSRTLPVDTVDRERRSLCMEQHYQVLSGYRRPGTPTDRLLTGHRPQGPRFIVVACRDQFYKVDVEQDGVTLGEGELYSQLYKVLTAAERHSAESPSVGALTAIDRSTWAKARQKLAEEPGNQQNLEALENCVVLLCLDKPTRGLSSSSPTAAGGDEDLTAQASYALHGEGTTFNSCNRWFDKSIQILVSEDGTVGMNCEHTVSEAGTMFAVLGHVQTYCDSSATLERKEEQQECRHLEDPQWLQWTVTSEMESDIARAKEEVDRNVRNVDICVQHFGGFGREFPKSQGVSPDGFLQLALQMAYYRLHGRMTMTYESASLRRFRSGRVDNIRANSPAALSWIQAMCGEVEATEAQKQALFRAAAEWQQRYQTETVRGYGIDCHLVGLREAARELNVLDSIPLFSDPSFLRAFRFPLATSQVPSNIPQLGFYGPITPDGYGVPYNLFPDYMIIVVTSFNDCADTDSRKFMNCLQSCFLDMRDSLLQKN